MKQVQSVEQQVQTAPAFPPSGHVILSGTGLLTMDSYTGINVLTSPNWGVELVLNTTGAYKIDITAAMDNVLSHVDPHPANLPTWQATLYELALEHPIFFFEGTNQTIEIVGSPTHL